MTLTRWSGVWAWYPPSLLALPTVVPLLHCIFIYFYFFHQCDEFLEELIFGEGVVVCGGNISALFKTPK